MVPLVNGYKKELQKTLKGIEPQTLLHDSVFVKIDQASKLFKVIVLKTEETIPTLPSSSNSIANIGHQRMKKQCGS